MSKLTDFKRYHKNPRRISEKQLKEMESWMEELGDLSGIVIDLNSQEIIGGNQRSKILEEGESVLQDVDPKKDGTVAWGYLEWKGRRFNLRHVRWTPEQCERANIIANKAGGEWDFEILSSEAWSTNQLLEFFTKEELPFIANEKKEIQEDNFDTTPPEEPVSRPGDVYELNHHRLRCGDSTTPSEIKDLMAGEKARLIFTDPPYGVTYTGVPNSKIWKEIGNDSLRENGLFQFLSMAFDAAQEATMDNAGIYCFYASRNHMLFETAMNATGWVVKQQLIWTKGTFVMGRSDYHYAHEPILYGHKEGQNSSWFGDRKQRTELITLTKTDLRKKTKEELLEMISVIREETDNWMNKQDNKGTYEHPTQKPIALAAKGIINSSLEDDIILDPFAGAGFVLLAAEQTDRRAYLQELDPAYVDVIIKRWIRWKEKKGQGFEIYKNGVKIPQPDLDKYTQ
jgi:DNA modification methylase